MAPKQDKRGNGKEEKQLTPKELAKAANKATAAAKAQEWREKHGCFQEHTDKFIQELLDRSEVLSNTQAPIHKCPSPFVSVEFVVVKRYPATENGRNSFTNEMQVFEPLEKSKTELRARESVRIAKCLGYNSNKLCILLKHYSTDLTDFGSSIDPAAADANLIATTPEYWAPELFSNPLFPWKLNSSQSFDGFNCTMF